MLLIPFINVSLKSIKLSQNMASGIPPTADLKYWQSEWK